MISCEEKYYFSKYNCFPNPFIDRQFVFNINEKHFKSICNQSVVSNNETNVCQNECIKDCNQYYYTLRLDNTHYLPRSDSIIKIKYNNLLEYIYKMQSKIDFIIYLSNIGGLVGLWMGFTVIDMSIMV